MRCPKCNADIPEGSTSCPVCGQTIIYSTPVVEPELVDDREYPKNEQPRFFYKQVFLSQENSLMPSCQMSLITLILALFAWLQYGFLAFLGFTFFSIIAKILIFFVNIRLIFRGIPANPLLMQGVAWFICWYLVAWLAS